MAGGLGTRFWPVSRADKPKQFLDFTHEGKSFLRRSFERMVQIIPMENILILTLRRYEDLVKEILPELPEANILYEPYNRSTAPCIAYATREILSRDPEAVVAVSPSDHIITDVDIFLNTMVRALDYAAANPDLVVMGIVPDRPDTNFGYIQVTGGHEAAVGDEPVKVKTFTEKPNIDLAKVFVDSGEFLWNSGMFVSQARIFWDELERWAPEITNLWKHSTLIEQIYADCPRVPFDYVVMEKTDRAMVFPAKFGWADIGNWDSVYEYMARKDADGNAINVVGGTRLINDTTTSIVFSSNEGKLIAVQGMKDMVVVDTPDVLLICPRDEKELKNFLSELAMPEWKNWR